jgi:ABC-type lipoprotein export system ATPase subunit
MSVLNLTAVAKTYGDVLALQPVELTLTAGELVVLTGPSGSGKSTLLMIAGGWETCDPGGEVRGPGTSWQETGFVPQSISLLDELTIADNLTFAHHRRDRDDTTPLLDALDLTRFAHRTPPEVSRGEQQRAAVARALAASPTLVLADEPTSHQDRHRAALVLHTLRAAADRGAAVLVAGHDPATHDYADREINLAKAAVHPR